MDRLQGRCSFNTGLLDRENKHFSHDRMQIDEGPGKRESGPRHQEPLARTMQKRMGGDSRLQQIAGTSIKNQRVEQRQRAEEMKAKKPPKEKPPRRKDVVEFFEDFKDRKLAEEGEYVGPKRKRRRKN